MGYEIDMNLIRFVKRDFIVRHGNDLCIDGFEYNRNVKIKIYFKIEDNIDSREYLLKPYDCNNNLLDVELISE